MHYKNKKPLGIKLTPKGFLFTIVIATKMGTISASYNKVTVVGGTAYLLNLVTQYNFHFLSTYIQILYILFL
ncbi:hypothetical protein GCM10022323_20360 [Asaccharospora irregularis DSM 2635]